MLGGGGILPFFCISVLHCCSLNWPQVDWTAALDCTPLYHTSLPLAGLHYCIVQDCDPYL